MRRSEVADRIRALEAVQSSLICGLQLINNMAKELRENIRLHSMLQGDTENHLRRGINALAEYLGVDFERAPGADVVVAVKKKKGGKK